MCILKILRFQLAVGIVLVCRMADASELGSTISFGSLLETR